MFAIDQFFSSPVRSRSNCLPFVETAVSMPFAIVTWVLYWLDRLIYFHQIKINQIQFQFYRIKSHSIVCWLWWWLYSTWLRRDKKGRNQEYLISDDFLLNPYYIALCDVVSIIRRFLISSAHFSMPVKRVMFNLRLMALTLLYPPSIPQRNTTMSCPW